MIDFAGYRYAPHKACIVCQHVLDGAPVLAFAHDDDGDLQFACGEADHIERDWHLIGLEHIDLMQPGLADLPRIDAGYEATRESIKGIWSIGPMS